MESVAYLFFWAGYLSAFVAASLCIVQVIGAWTVYWRGLTDAGTVTLRIRLALPQRIGSLAVWVSRTALVFLTVSLALRAAAAGRPPLGNLWEFTVAFGWGVTFFAVIFESFFRGRNVSAVVLPIGVALMSVAVAFFPHELRPLVPALQANRILAIHVTVMVLAYSAFSVSFGAAVLYFIQSAPGGARFSTLPDLETIEEIAYRAVIVGFPLLALGLALGAWWAHNAWGRYWGWDPKETSALMTWFIYAGYLHARNLSGWSGRRSAWLLVIGYGAVLFTYFAVNFWISGLHSYAGV